ncbi:ribonuclease H-like domain-containing protein [Tanacetum coccineum]
MTSLYPTPPFTVPSPSESSFSIPTTFEPVFSIATTEPVFESQTSHSAQPSQNTQPQFQQYNSTTVSSSNAKFPYLKKDEYETWAMKMEYWIMNSDHNLWNIVLHGNSRKRTGRDPRGNIMILPPVTMEEQIAVQRETKARTILLQSLPEDHMADFHHLDDAKDIWLAVKARFGGNEESKKMRKSMLKQEFADFKISESEGLHKGYDRFQKVLSQLNQMQARPDNEDCNMKFLRALPPSWSQVAITLKTKGGLDFLSFDDLYNKLRTLEIDVKGGSSYDSRVPAAPSHSAFISAASTNSKWSTADSKGQPSSVSYTTTSSSANASGNVLENVLHSFVAESDPQQQITYEDFDQIGKLDLEELDIKWQMAMLSVRINRFEKKADLIKEKVVKALYGLHQAPRAWYARLSTFLLKHNYRRGTINKTLFIKKNSRDIILVQVYVDDIIFGSTNQTWCDEFEVLMKGEFEMSAMGELTFFLGLQVKQQPDGIFISQDKYVQDMLRRFNMESVRPATTVTFRIFRYLYDGFVKAGGLHAVPGPITGTFMPPSNKPDIDDTQFTYGSKSNNSSETNSVSNDFVSCDNSDKSSDSETTDFASCVSSVQTSSSKTNEPLASASSSVDLKTLHKTDDQGPSNVTQSPSFSFKKNVKTPRNICNRNGSNNISLCKNKSFGCKKCFVCGSKFHLIQDCDFYENQLRLNNAPVWKNVETIPSFVPRPAYVPAGSRNRPTSVPAGRPFPAGWHNPAARPMTRPKSHYFQQFSRPGSYNQHWIWMGEDGNVLVLSHVVLGKVTSHICIGIQEQWWILNNLQGFPLIDPQGRPKTIHTNKDLGIVDSGCSRSMTGNKEKLADFVKIKGGTVTFGGGDGQITGKGTIRTSTFNFENNKVLFTDKECLVLSKEFQLPDSSQVVLRVPRRHNLYCFNLTDIHSEREIKCLLAKASLDESTKWHRRMAHESNTRPLKGTFSEQHHFCALSIHMDLFGPTSIRSIDHKHYSLVVTDDFSSLVTRPHNKTPYELLSGKVPNISHLKPFGCHVTILNTSDHLGKFEGKANEGFLVGYSAHRSGSMSDSTLILDYLTDSLGYYSFQFNQPACTQDTITHAGPKVHTASATVESTSDYAVELARLQGQAYEANSYYFRRCGSAVPSTPSSSVVEPVHADDTPLPPGHSLGSSENSTRFSSPSDLANHISSSSEMEGIHHHPTTSIFSESTYDADFGGSVTNFCTTHSCDSCSTRGCSVHPYPELLGISTYRSGKGAL